MKLYANLFYLLGAFMFALSLLWWASVFFAGMASFAAAAESPEAAGLAALLGGALISTQVLTSSALTATACLLWIAGNLEESQAMAKAKEKSDG